MEHIEELTRRLADPSFFLTQEFTDLLTHLRGHSPVHWCQAWPERGFWAITRHADLKAVYEQPLLFSNEAAGNIIPADPELHRGDRDAMGFGAMTPNTDPPHHGVLRRVYSRGLAGPQVAKLETMCQELVDEILDDVRERDTFDFVMDAAAHLPARLILRLLGAPSEHWPMLTVYANAFASFADPALQLGETPGKTFQIAMGTTFEYVRKLVEQRRLDPRDDFASMAAHAETDGVRLSEREAAWSAWSLLAAGFETSRNIITGGLLALIEHPDQRALLVPGAPLPQTAIDEMIRWTMPATANLRVATDDATIAGQQIAKGDWVVLFIESANRDERVFDDPFRFDITRRRNPHLSFGHGVHNCFGRMLAMLEVKVMIRSVLDATSAIELAGPLERTSSTIAKGVNHMPVRFHWKSPARAAA